MKILSVHAQYVQRGGEDQVREGERDLLRQHDHTVIEYLQTNDSIQSKQPWSIAARSLWSQTDYRKVRQVIQRTRADLMHVHNLFPLISPAVYYAAHAEHIPVVQTLHNYRLICPAATLLRKGELCQACVGRTIAVPGVRHACYRESRLLSSGVAAMSSLHRIINTWNTMVNQYIAPTDFVRSRYIAGGFPPDKIIVKPNFTRDSEIGSGKGNYFLFVGRLSVEKGVAHLLKAWQLAQPARDLIIIGTGPEDLNLRTQAARLERVHFLGEQPREVVEQKMGEAAALIVPSIWHEPFGLTIIEAYAKGTPVFATNLGGLSSLVQHGETGFLFERGDVDTLAHLLVNFEQDPRLRRGARSYFEARYTPDRNYEMLAAVYQQCVA